MTSPVPRDAESACLASLESALASGGLPDLTGVTRATLDGALQTLVRQRGVAAAEILRRVADQASSKELRKAARLAIYRMRQAGLTVPPPAARYAAAPVVRRQTERAVRAWLSGIDGRGSRAIWILFEGGLRGGLLLCSLLLNDESGILEAAGGPITRKRLDAELRALREHQKLPWVETPPARARGLVMEALAFHSRIGTDPPPEFSRWRRLFASPPDPEPDESAAPVSPEADRDLLDRSARLGDFPELKSWFVDPPSIQEDALALLQARESRLVVSDQIKAEREAAIVDAVIERHFTAKTRPRWARRLREMALIFHATGRDDPARLADATARALEDLARPAHRIPFVRVMALRGLELAADVTLGRAKLADVSRPPLKKTRS